MTLNQKQLHDQLGKETPQKADVPPTEVQLYPKKLMFEVVKKDGTLFIHVFKPVEKEIREREEWIREQCPALYPLSEDLGERRLQLAMQKEQEKCDARRMAWRDGGGQAAWPVMSDILLQVANDTGLGQLDGVIEFTRDMDAWVVALKKGDELSDARIKRFMDGVVAEFDKLKVKWPPEIWTK